VRAPNDCALLDGQTVSFLQSEAAEAARHELELHKAYALAARFATTPAVRESFEEMAISAKLSGESWMMLANYLWLQGVLGRAADQDPA
jgi:hypothetical protein